MERKYAKQLLDELMQQAIRLSPEDEMQEIALCRAAAEECDVLLGDSIKSKWPPNLSRSLLKKIKELKENLGKLELFYALEKDGKFNPNAKELLTRVVQIAKKMRRDRLYQRELWLLQEQERLKKLAEDFREWKEDLDIRLKQSLEQLENFFVTYKAEADVWQARLSYLQKQLAGLELRIAAIDEEISRLNKQAQEIALQIEQNNEQIRQNEASIEVIEREDNRVLDEMRDTFRQVIFGFFQKKSVQLTAAKSKDIEDSITTFVNDNKKSIICDSEESLHPKYEEFCMNHIEQNLTAEQKEEWLESKLEELRGQFSSVIQKLKKLGGELDELKEKKERLEKANKILLKENQGLKDEIKLLEEEIKQKTTEKNQLIAIRAKVGKKIDFVKELKETESELLEKEEVNPAKAITFG